MKYIWSESDLGWGRYIIKNTGKKEYKSTHIGLTHVWKLGGDGCNPTKVCMGDGFVVRYDSKEKLLFYLNKDSGFRPIRKEEFINMVEHNWDYHEGIK